MEFPWDRQNGPDEASTSLAAEGTTNILLDLDDKTLQVNILWFKCSMMVSGIVPHCPQMQRTEWLCVASPDMCRIIAAQCLVAAEGPSLALHPEASNAGTSSAGPSTSGRDKRKQGGDLAFSSWLSDKFGDEEGDEADESGEANGDSGQLLVGLGEDWSVEWFLGGSGRHAGHGLFKHANLCLYCENRSSRGIATANR